MITDRKSFCILLFGNEWCPFVYLFDTLFQNSPYGHECGT